MKTVELGTILEFAPPCPVAAAQAAAPSAE